MTPTLFDSAPEPEKLVPPGPGYFGTTPPPVFPSSSPVPPVPTAPPANQIPDVGDKIGDKGKGGEKADEEKGAAKQQPAAKEPAGSVFRTYSRGAAGLNGFSNAFAPFTFTLRLYTLSPQVA